MKYRQPHKTLLLCVPTFSSGSHLEENVLHLKKVYEKFVKRVNLVRYGTTYALETIKIQHVSEDAILILGNARRHPKTACNAPFIIKGSKKIPIGWLPFRNAEDILRFSNTLERVHSREQDDCVVALLSQRHPRFTRLVHRMEHILDKRAVPLRWSSDVILREDVVNGLEEGVGLAAYFGHGRPIGWVGYYGFRAHHFTENTREPIGGLLSLCCKTASRKNTKLSFCEELVLNQKCAATFGAVDSTLHTDNTRWSVGLCSALLKGARSIGDLVVEAMPQNKTAFASYRLIGDPLAPIYSTSKVSTHVQQIKTYS
ncbi:C25 family cysteine peptidase [Pareuzebyella sediminis]|uniref:C25 family cysteine peptidase n=1 Tax=Pareuzebyella sediminis TaxID=2607998 RepID=UPI0011F09858|nr:C25 family cysteine peptidase [Pareuzebyella sediminis]